MAGCTFNFRSYYGCIALFLEVPLKTEVCSTCQVSERIDENIDRLNQSLVLWDDVHKISDDIESWASNGLIELNEALNNLNDTQKVSERLSVLKVSSLPQ